MPPPTQSKLMLNNGYVGMHVFKHQLRSMNHNLQCHDTIILLNEDTNTIFFNNNIILIHILQIAVPFPRADHATHAY